MGSVEMKFRLSAGQILSYMIGIFVVLAVDLFSPWSLSGPGIEGALRAGFWYGLVGIGGGLGAYEIVQRVKSRLGKSENSN
jgi:hypothetical protein